MSKREDVLWGIGLGWALGAFMFLNGIVGDWMFGARAIGRLGGPPSLATVAGIWFLGSTVGGILYGLQRPLLNRLSGAMLAGISSMFVFTVTSEAAKHGAIALSAKELLLAVFVAVIAGPLIFGIMWWWVRRGALAAAGAQTD